MKNIKIIGNKDTIKKGKLVRKNIIKTTLIIVISTIAVFPFIKLSNTIGYSISYLCNKQYVDNKNEILDEVIELTKNYEFKNVAQVCGYFKELYNNGNLSIDDIYSSGVSTEVNDIFCEHGCDVINGAGCCRHEANLTTDFLNKKGYFAVQIMNDVGHNIENASLTAHDFILIIENKTMYICDTINNEIFSLNNLNEAISHDDKYKAKLKIFLTSLLNHKFNPIELTKILLNQNFNVDKEKLMNDYLNGMDIYYETIDDVEILKSNISDEKENIKQYKIKHQK